MSKSSPRVNALELLRQYDDVEQKVVSLKEGHIQGLSIMKDLIREVMIRPNLGYEAISHLPRAMFAYKAYSVDGIITRFEAEEEIANVIKYVRADKNVIVEIVSKTLSSLKTLKAGIFSSILTIPIGIQVWCFTHAIDLLANEMKTTGGAFLITQLSCKSIVEFYKERNYLKFVKNIYDTFFGSEFNSEFDLSVYKDSFLESLKRITEATMSSVTPSEETYLGSSINSILGYFNNRIFKPLTEPLSHITAGHVNAEFARAKESVSSIIKTLGSSAKNTKNLITGFMILAVFILIVFIIYKVDDIMKGRKIKRIIDDKDKLDKYNFEVLFNSKKSVKKSTNKSLKKSMKKSSKKSLKKTVKKSLKKPTKKPTKKYN
jgi:hypothetical protein